MIKGNAEVCYVIEWLDGDGQSLQTISVCEDGRGVIYDGRHLEIVGDTIINTRYLDEILDDFQDRTLYRIPPRLLSCLFGAATSDEFFHTSLSLYDTCEDFRNKAYRDDGGGVLLFLTEEQEVAWLVENATDIAAFDAMAGVEVAEDFSRITVTRPQEEMYEFLLENFNLYTPFDMVVRQIILGKDPNIVTAEIVLIDEGSGEVIYSAKWPDEAIHLEQ